MTRRLAAVTLALTFAAAACGGGGGEAAGSSTSETLELEAYDYYFKPTSLSVEPGAEVTVEFTNNGSVSHSFTSPDLDTELELGNAEDGNVKFTAPAEPGSFDFYCKFHPDDMQGTISVGGEEAPAEEQPADEDEEDVDVDVDTGEDTTKSDY